MSAEDNPGEGELVAASQSQSLRAQARLREAILAGALAPGERLTEQALVVRLGVSRTPIRTALLRLAEEGLLEEVAGGGYAVRSYSEAEIRDAIELRGTLEGLAARLAAERGVALERLAALGAVVADMDAALETATGEALDEHRFTRYMSANARFHELIANLPGSPLLARQLQRVAGFAFASPSAFVLVQATDPVLRASFALAQEQHRLVVAAIAAREGARAEALMREHARIAHRNLRAALANPRMLELLPGGALVRAAAG